MTTYTSSGPSKKILAICGSTRQSSSNKDLIHAIINLFKNRVHFIIWETLESIPVFNPDLDGDDPPLPVGKFREAVNAADGILICTPEYAMGVPGALKNAIDWTVSSMEFSKKPVALITASSLGEKGHASLLATLEVIEAFIPANFRLLIPFIKAKIKGSEITDVNTLDQVNALMDNFISFLYNPEVFPNT